MSKDKIYKPVYLRRTAAALSIGVPVATFKHWNSDRYKGEQPPKKPFGKTYMWREDQLHAWFNRNHAAEIDTNSENMSANSAKEAKKDKMSK